MEKHQLIGQLKQLLRSGHSIEDFRHMAIAPRAMIEQAILEYKAQQEEKEKTLRPLRQQAEFAMYLGAR